MKEQQGLEGGDSNDKNDKLKIVNTTDLRILVFVKQTRTSSQNVDSWSFLKPIKNSGLCYAEVKDHKTTNRQPVILSPCDSNYFSQQWQIDSWGRLKNRRSGKCLVATIDGSLYAKAYIYTCDSQPWQRWILEDSKCSAWLLYWSCLL